MNVFNNHNFAERTRNLKVFYLLIILPKISVQVQIRPNVFKCHILRVKLYFIFKHNRFIQKFTLFWSNGMNQSSEMLNFKRIFRDLGVYIIVFPKNIIYHKIMAWLHFLSFFNPFWKVFIIFVCKRSKCCFSSNVQHWV